MCARNNISMKMVKIDLDKIETMEDIIKLLKAIDVEISLPDYNVSKYKLEHLIEGIYMERL